MRTVNVPDVAPDGAVVVDVMIAPSGILVYSSVPFYDWMWWDEPGLHILWSWLSWTTHILGDLGWSAPRRWFIGWGRRP